jgi:hypothetical protein
MERNRKLTFGATLGIVRLCSPKPLPVKAAAPDPKPKQTLIQAVEPNMAIKLERGL